MEFKLVSKNNVGFVSTLVLVILLSQSRCFDFLTETPLGRMFLLGITIFITYTNKIFGLLAVIFIIIAFNLNDFNIVKSYNFYEGFDDSENVMDENNAIGENMLREKINDIQKDSKGNDNKKSTLKEKENIADASQTIATISSSVSDSSREGFCMCDRELNILRGKPSNTVPVFSNSREQSDEVDPSDKSVFSSDYALI